jgi:diguanylate cyclase (GGDEF)-like protein
MHRSVDSAVGGRFAPATSPRSRTALRRELTQLIDGGRIVAAVQPIVRLYDGTAIGYEALARFPPTEHFTTPDELFGAAASLDVKSAVDIACVRAALREAPNLGDTDLFVNVLIRTLLDAGGMRALHAAVSDARLDPASIVLEFSERDPVPDLERLQRIAADLRSHGFRIAVDDAGAGHASMRVIAELRPEFIKVDRSLIHAVDTDRARRALVVSLLSFGGHIGARLIAEGIETQSEEDALQSLGVQFGQGWHLGRPVLAQAVEGHDDVEVVIPGWFAQRPVSRVRSAPEGPLLHLAQPAVLPSVQPRPSRVRSGLPRALSDAALALQTEHDPMRILGVMAEQLARVVPVTEMAIFVADYETHRFNPVLATGPDADEILADAFSLDAGITGWAFAKGIPENVDDTADHPLARQVPGTAVVHESLLLIPLVAAERKLGIINCWRVGIGQFSARELEAGSLFAHIAAAAWRNAQLYTELLSAAMTDPLTGLFNSRWLRDAAQRELVRGARDPQPFSLLLIDLDHFKTVNDNGGHAAGDLVLQRIATRLRASVRGADAVVRLGGEEFVVLLHGCDADGGAMVAEAVRVAISRLALPERARLGRLTASIGIASYPEHGDHLDELLAAADRAMYAAKHGGRNRVVRAPAPAERSRLAPAGPRLGRPPRVEIVEPRRAG